MQKPCPRKYRNLQPHLRTPKLRGDLAEMIFLPEAAFRRLLVSKPFGDSFPYDFIVDNGHTCYRVQVKSTSECGRNGLYQIHSGRTLRRTKTYARHEIDFMAFYIFRERAWYIIPLSAIRGRLAVTLYSPERHDCGLYSQYYEAWHLLKKPRRCDHCNLTLRAWADPTFAASQPTL